MRTAYASNREPLTVQYEGEVEDADPHAFPAKTHYDRREDL